MTATKKSRLAILTSGGDAPGMNAAIRAAALIAIREGWDVLGVRRGYRGLIDGDLRPLPAESVVDVIRAGGTILGSARCPDLEERPARDAARATLAEHAVDGLIVIGGDGSLRGARAIADPAEAGDGFATRVIGVPASIDNDVGFTSASIGVDTAMNTIVEACDKISDTASAHDRTFFVEVMGRASGYLAMTTSIASAADGVIFPEAHASEEEIVEHVVDTIERARARTDRPKRVVVIVAEGAGVPMERLQRAVEARVAERLGEPDGNFETRATVLGHVVRGGRPSAFDRLLASRLAHVAVKALIAGKTLKMAAWLLPGKIPSRLAVPSEADPYCWLVDLDAALVATERLRRGTSQMVRWGVRIFEELGTSLAM